MTIVTETFTSAFTSSNWPTIRGTTALSRITADDSGAIRTTTNGNSRHVTSLGGMDQFVEMKLTSSGSDGDKSWFLLARVNPSATNGTTSTWSYYALTGNAANGTYALLKYPGSNSAVNLLGSSGSSSWAAGDVPQLRVTGVGSAVTLSAYKNGVLINSVDDTASNRIINSSYTYAGIGFFNCGTATTPSLRADDWRAGLVSDLVGMEPGRMLLAV